MELRLIDQKEPAISLDLLLEWTSNTLRRTPGRPEPLGCPWAAMSMAIMHAGVEGAGTLLAAERLLRQSLVLVYRQQWRQGEEDVGRIIDAKAREAQLRGGTLPQLLGLPDRSEALRRWPWYLYCLTFPSKEKLEEEAARMPMDMVDLQAIALCLKISITVSQFRQEPIRFQPPSEQPTRAVHLVYNKGCWAPLLGTAQPEKENHALVGSIVELAGDLEVSQGRLVDYCSSLGGQNGCVGTIVRIDSGRDSYEVCLGWRRALVSREHILRVIFQPSKNWWAEPNDNSWGGSKEKCQIEASLDNSPLAGVPNTSLEWQVLHDLVRLQARAHLETLMQQLAGRDMSSKDVVPSRVQERAPGLPEATDAADAAQAQLGADGAAVAGAAAPEGDGQQDAVAQLLPAWLELGAEGPGAALVRQRVAFQDVVQLVDYGCELSVAVVQAYPQAGVPLDRGHAPVAVGDEVSIQRVGKEWAYVVHRRPGASTRGAVSEGWCPLECLRVWEAHTTWRVDAGSRDAASFLALDAPDAMVLVRAYENEWADWGYGSRWGQKKGSGIFPLFVAEPRALVVSCAWSA